MPNETYELIALGARYWFVFLGIVIVWRSYAWLLSDNRARRRVLRNLPDAGMVGEIVDLDSGKAYPLPREGVLGSSHNCDIRLRGLRRRHAVFAFLDGRGVQFIPRHRNDILIDGLPVRKGGYAVHGTRIETGGYLLRVRLFAGLNVPRPAVYLSDLPDMPLLQGNMPLPELAVEDDLWAANIPDNGFILPADNLADHRGLPLPDPQLTWQYAPLPPDNACYEPDDRSGYISDENDISYQTEQKAARRIWSRISRHTDE